MNLDKLLRINQFSVAPTLSSFIKVYRDKPIGLNDFDPTVFYTPYISQYNEKIIKSLKKQDGWYTIESTVDTSYTTVEQHIALKSQEGYKDKLDKIYKIRNRRARIAQITVSADVVLENVQVQVNYGYLHRPENESVLITIEDSTNTDEFIDEFKVKFVAASNGFFIAPFITINTSGAKTMNFVLEYCPPNFYIEVIHSLPISTSTDILFIDRAVQLQHPVSFYKTKQVDLAGIPAWDAATVYEPGDKVVYAGEGYQARWYMFETQPQKDAEFYDDWMPLRHAYTATDYDVNGDEITLNIYDMFEAVSSIVFQNENFSLSGRYPSPTSLYILPSSTFILNKDNFFPVEPENYDSMEFLNVSLDLLGEKLEVNSDGLTLIQNEYIQTLRAVKYFSSSEDDQSYYDGYYDDFGNFIPTLHHIKIQSHSLMQSTYKLAQIRIDNGMSFSIDELEILPDIDLSATPIYEIDRLDTRENIDSDIVTTINISPESGIFFDMPYVIGNIGTTIIRGVVGGNYNYSGTEELVVFYDSQSRKYGFNNFSGFSYGETEIKTDDEVIYPPGDPRERYYRTPSFFYGDDAFDAINDAKAGFWLDVIENVLPPDNSVVINNIITIPEIMHTCYIETDIDSDAEHAVLGTFNSGYHHYNYKYKKVFLPCYMSPEKFMKEIPLFIFATNPQEPTKILIVKLTIEYDEIEDTLNRDDAPKVLNITQVIESTYIQALGASTFDFSNLINLCNTYNDLWNSGADESQLTSALSAVFNEMETIWKAQFTEVRNDLMISPDVYYGLKPGSYSFVQ